jgi:hypothetical protein
MDKKIPRNQKGQAPTHGGNETAKRLGEKAREQRGGENKRRTEERARSARGK